MSWWRCAVLSVCLVLVGCSESEAGGFNGQANVEVVSRPTTAEELGIRLDRHGHPLAGSSAGDGGKHEFESLGMFSVPDGQLLLTDGIALSVAPTPEDGVSVDLPAEQLELLVLRVIDDDGRRYPSNSLVLLRVPNAGPVSYWSDLEYAYGTDGGLGGFTNPTVFEEASQQPMDSYFLDLGDFESDHYLFDLDDLPGNDTFVFGNGRGDGGFPYALGFTANDETAVLAIWNMFYPWREVFPDSTPPPAITRREADLFACMEGTRPVEVSMDTYVSCPSEDW